MVWLQDPGRLRCLGHSPDTCSLLTLPGESCCKGGPSEKGRVGHGWRKGEAAGRGHDPHVQKTERELGRLSQLQQLRRTFLSPQPMLGCTETPALGWFLGEFVRSLGEAGDASCRGREGTPDYSFPDKSN